MKGKKHQHKV